MNDNKMQSINGLLRNRKTMSQLFWFRHFDRFSGEFLIGTEFSIIQNHMCRLATVYRFVIFFFPKYHDPRRSNISTEYQSA